LIHSVPDSLSTLAMPITTPECTVPMTTSTLSRCTSLLTFSGALAGIGFVIHGDEFDFAPGELAAALIDRQLEAVGDGDAKLGEGAGVGQHQADLELGLLRHGRLPAAAFQPRWHRRWPLFP
jgi:hypothetical protein